MQVLQDAFPDYTREDNGKDYRRVAAVEIYAAQRLGNFLCDIVKIGFHCVSS